MQVAELDVAVKLIRQAPTMRWLSMSDDSGTAATNMMEKITSAETSPIETQNHGRWISGRRFAELS